MKGMVLGGIQGILFALGLALIITQQNYVFLAAVASLGLLIGGITGMFLSRQVDHDIYAYLILGPFLSGLIAFLFAFALNVLVNSQNLAARWLVVVALLGTAPGFLVGWALGRNAQEINDRRTVRPVRRRTQITGGTPALVSSVGGSVPSSYTPSWAPQQHGSLLHNVQLQVRDLESRGCSADIRHLPNSDTFVVLMSLNVESFDEFGELKHRPVRVYLEYADDGPHEKEPNVLAEIQNSTGQWVELNVNNGSTSDHSVGNIVDEVRRVAVNAKV